MKEELIRVLNNRLNSINNDIDSLKDLNTKIDEESEKLSFIDSIINLFKENDDVNPMNFDKIDRDDFDRVLNITGDEVKNLFNTGSCNYEGLVYLISGIKSGVSISLTNEQLNGIEYLIQSLTNKKEESNGKINELNEEKTKYEISDVNELKIHKDKFEKTLSDIDKGEYIKDIDLLKEAIDFAKITPEEIINILSFVLSYNADLYKKNKTLIEEEKTEEIKEASQDLPQEEVMEEISLEPVENEFHFNQIENDNMFDLPNITFDDNEKENVEDDLSSTVSENQKENAFQEYQTQEEPAFEQTKEPTVDEEIANNIVDENSTEIVTDQVSSETPVDTNEEVSSFDMPLEIKPETVFEGDNTEVEQESPSAFEPVTPVIEPEVPMFEPETVLPQEKIEVAKEPEIDNDFKDVLTGKDDYDDNAYEKEDEKTSTRELHKIFSKYGIEENIVLNELIDGNVTEYQNILDSLKDHAILDYFKKNKDLLIETLLYSNVNVIDRVLKIVKDDLSVDEEDYAITLKIVINTIPSIFIIEGGNYNNFVKNVELFKKLEINLINLFDFSKEIFIADHEMIENNLAIVNKYDLDINYKNAKYLLLIPHIEEKIDYYIESVYVDKTKNETFDGINYIKEYAAKLNVVTDETIKRLRYASMNGNKVFGNKPGSLAGEITNLKVNALDLNNEYLSKFFNNEFNNISLDEVREYVKLNRNSTNVGDYSDELDILNGYRNGLRYNIEGINISYNKVLRNYNVLRSYGIDAKKALQFAVCYNLVITKDEYNKLSDVLNRIGGNA